MVVWTDDEDNRVIPHLRTQADVDRWSTSVYIISISAYLHSPLDNVSF
jgi:hypothetical protein